MRDVRARNLWRRWVRTGGRFPELGQEDGRQKNEPVGAPNLEIYKFQPFLEKRYTQLKTYQEIAPVYLKNPKRVVAFLHVHVMALMVSTLIERTIRKAMKKEGIKSLPIYPEGRPCP